VNGFCRKPTPARPEMRGRFAGRAGVGFLQKPFTVRALSEAVASVLGPSA